MRRVPQAAFRTVLSVVILLALFIGGGIAYVWYTGQNAPDLTSTSSAPTSSTLGTLTPTKPAANANPSASVQMLTSPVAPGDNALISIKTLATSVCDIKVLYNDVPSTDSGLTAKTADEFGTVSWSWTVGAATPEGTWPVTVTCVYNGRSAVVQGELVVER